MRYYVVADIHGFYSELIIALTEKGFFKDENPHKLIVCGDLFDRGQEAFKLQEFIIDLMKKDEVILIRGNHEDLILKLVNDYHRWMVEPVVYTAHWSNGTVGTVMQLTGMDLQEITINAKAMKMRMENTPFFKKILPAMVNYFETEHYIFVHGWISCNASGYGGVASNFSYNSEWRNADYIDWDFARWYNGIEAANQGVIEPNKTIVCGHWHCSYGHAKFEKKGEERGENADYSPYYGKGIIALDACTALSKKVNCLVIED